MRVGVGEGGCVGVGESVLVGIGVDVGLLTAVAVPVGES
jgi:hypothetical protein